MALNMVKEGYVAVAVDNAAAGEASDLDYYNPQLTYHRCRAHRPILLWSFRTPECTKLRVLHPSNVPVSKPEKWKLTLEKDRTPISLKYIPLFFPFSHRQETVVPLSRETS